MVRRTGLLLTTTRCGSIGKPTTTYGVVAVLLGDDFEAQDTAVEDITKSGTGQELDALRIRRKAPKG